MCTNLVCDVESPDVEASCTPEHIWEWRSHLVAQYIDEEFYVGSKPTWEGIQDSVWAAFDTVTCEIPPTEEMFEYGMERALVFFEEIAAEYGYVLN
jgi:hypothetical protein